jgi:NAD(P)-dependent dehydrogenase (short-subunit alcohol dehydrogenase family)
MPTDLFDMNGQVALITGGSRGLGRQMALAFAGLGADIVIASRKMDACEATAKEVEALGRRALPYACHVGDWDALEGLSNAAFDTFGHVDVLVNNAGMSPLSEGGSVGVSEALYDKVIDVNFKGPFRLSALVGSRMVGQADGGAILNISSTAAIRPSPAFGPYSGAKAALNALTTVFALEYAPKVRVNTIMAGPFLTDIAKAWTPEAREKAANVLGRPGQPNEIVSAAIYLCSRASSFTTNSVIEVSGGTR